MYNLCPVFILILVAFSNTSFAQEKSANKRISIGVLQSFSHPNFEADVKGFEKALTEAGLKEGVQLAYRHQNAKGNENNAEKIAQRFLDDEVDLIHSVASLASRAAVKKVRHLPIVFTSVTNPVDEGVVPKTNPPETKSGTNVTGVTDRWSVQLQFEIYASFFPKAKRWGTLYNRADPKSLLHIREMRETAKRLGIELIESTLSSRAGTLPAARALAGKIQVMSITFDTTALSALEEIVKACNEKKIPLFVGDPDQVPSGAIAAYGSTYLEVGYAAGKKAVGILKGERPGKIPWGPVEKLSLVVNEKAAKAQGVVIPAEFLKKAEKIIKE